MKQLIQVSLLIFMAFPAMSQQQAEESESAARAKEREIKTSGEYLYGESVANTKAEAIKLAKSILASEINKEILTRKDWQFAKEISAKDVEYSVESIDLARGSKMRAIAYVRKDGIEAIFDKNKTPKVSLEDKKVEKESTRNQPVVQPDIAEIATQTIDEDIPDTSESIEIPLTNNPVLDEILPCKTIREVTVVFENYKKKGKLAYGRAGTNLSSENSWLMIYNQAGEIIAFLDKGQGTTRRNLLTGEQVSTQSFNAAQIWFQIFD